MWFACLKISLGNLKLNSQNNCFSLLLGVIQIVTEKVFFFNYEFFPAIINLFVDTLY